MISQTVSATLSWVLVDIQMIQHGNRTGRMESLARSGYAKKAEWIAGDAALRRKDKAAWQRVAPCTLTLDNEKTSRKESSQ